MTARKILLASPAEPSGASWLLNCFLELGIRIDHKPVVDRVWRSSRARPDRMWRTVDGRWHLDPKAAVLRKWMPALSRPDGLDLRSDVAVEYVQDFAPAAAPARPTVYFVRDPRDALHSMYRRRRPDLTLEEFLGLPNPRTLLDAVDHWALHAEGWCEVPGVHVFRFEEYKRDARGLLTRILACLDMDAEPGDVAHAVEASTFERCRAAEAAYRAEYPGDDEVANRAGKVGEWTERGELADFAARVERGARGTLARLGYATARDDVVGQGFSGAASLATVAFLRTVRIPPALAALAADAGAVAASAHRLLAVAAGLDEDRLRRSRLAPDELRTLLHNLARFAEAHDRDLAGSLRRMGESFAEGSDYHFARLKDLLARQRRTRASE